MEPWPTSCRSAGANSAYEWPSAGRRGHILGLVLREGLALALAGVIVGGGATFAMRRALASQLFGIGPADPRVLIVITVSLTVIAMAASLLPARGATRVDVMKTLKTE